MRHRRIPIADFQRASIEVAIRKRCAGALEPFRCRTKASFGACTGRDPRCFADVLVPLLTPHQQPFRRLDEILAEEDEAELARSEIEWLERFHDAIRDDASDGGIRYVNIRLPCRER